MATAVVTAGRPAAYAEQWTWATALKRPVRKILFNPTYLRQTPKPPSSELWGHYEQFNRITDWQAIATPIAEDQFADWIGFTFFTSRGDLSAQRSLMNAYQVHQGINGLALIAQLKKTPLVSISYDDGQNLYPGAQHLIQLRYGAVAHAPKRPADALQSIEDELLKLPDTAGYPPIDVIKQPVEVYLKALYAD